MSWKTLLLAALTLSATASTSWAASTNSSFSSHVLKERVDESPHGWLRIGPAPPTHRLRLHIGLKQGHFDELERHLYEVSDPFHSRYGQHLTVDQVNSLIRPSDDTLSLVENWLDSYGLPTQQLEYSPGKDWITIPAAPVSLAEKLFQTSYHVWRRGEQEIVRATEWSLPSELHGVVDTVQPTISFFQLHARATADGESTPTSLNQAAESLPEGLDVTKGIDLANPPSDLTAEKACNTSAVTALCLRTLYGTLNYTAQAPEKNGMAITNYLGGFNNRSDTRRYLEIYRPEAVRAADEFTSMEIAGAVNQQTPATQEQLDRGEGREGDLDAQVMLGIGFPTPMVAYSTGGEPPPFQPDVVNPDDAIDNEPFLTWLQYVLSQPDLPSVISTSYGDIEYTVPESYARRVCQSFAQLGARGVSVVFGSGDAGIGKPGTCHSADNAATPRFVPRFPDSCPYITSVAATRGINPEAVAYNDRNGFVSGGGFSEYFPRPKYQDKAVESYLRNLSPEHIYEGLYNDRGRAYPDVAAMGYRIVTIWNGGTKVIDGTSASAPIFAAVMALVNDALIAEGKPPLGFLNPWIYSVGFEGFTDITDGMTSGCNTSGFPAAQGWDIASGFGTPVSSQMPPVSFAWGPCA